MEDFIELDTNKFYADRQRFWRQLNGDAYDRGESWDDWRKVDAMIWNWEKLVKEIRVEAIQCKRKRRATDKYINLLKKFNEYQDEIEQAVTMYVLLYKTG